MSYKVQHIFEGGAWKGMYTRASLSSSDHHLGKAQVPEGTQVLLEVCRRGLQTPTL